MLYICADFEEKFLPDAFMMPVPTEELCLGIDFFFLITLLRALAEPDPMEDWW